MRGFDNNVALVIQEPGIVLREFYEGSLPFDILQDEVEKIRAVFNNGPVYPDPVIYIVAFCFQEGTV